MAKQQLQLRWLSDWEQRPYKRFMPAKCNRFPNLKPKILYHGMEGVFYAKQTLYNFAVAETKLPVHFWYADEDTTRWQYESYKGSKRRVLGDDGKPVAVRAGYSCKLQTLPLDVIAWSARSCKGAVNYGGEIVLALEDMVWAGDCGMMTEDELYRRGLVIASMSTGIMRFLDTDFVPTPFHNVGKPWPASKGKYNGQRIKRKEYLDDVFLAGRDVLPHSVLPRPNSHGDVADLNLGVICEIARNELNQSTPAVKKKAPAKKVKTSPKKAAQKNTPSAILGDTAELLDKAASNIKTIIGELK